MTVPPADSNAASTANLNCEYIPHPNGIHEMVIYTSKVETIDEMLTKFNIMYTTTQTQDRQLVLIHDLTKTGLPLTPLFSRLRAWVRTHPLHPNPRVAVLFGHNNLLGMLGSFLGSMGIAPRRVTMWKPSQREQAEAWLLSEPK